METITTPPSVLRRGDERQNERSPLEPSSQTSSYKKALLRTTSSQSWSQDFEHKHRQATRDLAPGIPFLNGPACKFHTLAEAGGSVWVSSRVILLWRLCCTWLFVFTLGLFAPSGQFNYCWLSTWIYIGVTCTMILSTFSSLFYHLYPERSSSVISGQWLFLFIANTTVCMYQVFLSLSAGVDLVYWLLLNERQGVLTSRIFLHVVNFLLLFIDSLLSFRMMFHLTYVFVAVAIVAAWLIFAWIRYTITKQWIHQVLDFKIVGTSRAVKAHIAIVVTFLVVCIFFLLLNRLNRLNVISRRISAIIADELEVSKESITTDEENQMDSDLEDIIIESRAKL